MCIVDAHAHHFMLGESAERELAESLSRGVLAVVENGLGPGSNDEVLRLARRFPGRVFPALGFHPTDVVRAGDEEVAREVRRIESLVGEIVAIGEVGVDRYWYSDEGSFRRQVRWFSEFLGLGERLGKPVIVHSRRAEAEALDLVSSYRAVVVMHSFWAPKLVKRAVDLGVYVSVPAFVYRDEGLRRIAREVPLDLLLTETDAPFLDPVERRNNRSWKIVYGLRAIAEARRENPVEVARAVCRNFSRVFKLELDCNCDSLQI